MSLENESLCNPTIDLRYRFPFPYPQAPNVRFATPIYHYAVDTAGTMCLPLLQEQWSPGATVTQVLSGIADLVNDPATYDPLANYSRRSWLSEPVASIAVTHPEV